MNLSSVILFGFKSCGKTHFGSLLARELRRAFVDTDQLIEQENNLSCREIALQIGDAGFRTLERKVIASLKGDAIISVGGGAILDPRNLTRLEKLGNLVYIETDKETLKRRILSGKLPSYLDPRDPEGSFEQMYIHRKVLYEQIRAHKVSTREKTEEQILSELLRICKIY